MSRARWLAIAALAVACDDTERAKPSAAPSTPPQAAPATAASSTITEGTLWFVDGDELVAQTGDQRRTIGHGLYPSRWRLPDGRLVAIASKGDGSADSEQLALVAADGTVTRLGFAASQVRDPAVDPEGTWIVVAANRDGHSDLYRIDVATGKDTRLTDNPQGNFAPVLAGDSIVFVSSRDGDSEIYRLVPRAKQPQRLTAFHRDDWAPAPSPDGKTIVFASDREGPVRLFVMAIDGTGQRRLTARGDDAEEGDPVWSPDGTRIAYTAKQRGRSTVWLHELATGQTRVLTPDGASDHEPAWAPSGRSIVVSRQGERADVHELWTIALDGDRATRIGTGKQRLPRWL